MNYHPSLPGIYISYFVITIYVIVSYRFHVAVGSTGMVEEARDVPLLRRVDESIFVQANNVILRYRGRSEEKRKS